MNRYHIEVVGSSKPYKEIVADYMDSTKDGCYVFSIKDVNNILAPVAYFPIHKTCIIEIEYDSENYE